MSARAVIPAFMLCAACSAQTGSAPTLLPSAIASSGSAVADASGAVDVELSHKTSGVYIDEDGLGFSYVLGLQGTSWAAYSALGHWTPPPDLPSGGKIKFNAQYALAFCANKRRARRMSSVIMAPLSCWPIWMRKGFPVKLQRSAFLGSFRALILMAAFRFAACRGS